MSKHFMLILVIGLVSVVLLLGCVNGGGEKKVAQARKQVIEPTTAVSTQEMKTYVSRFGFSVSYPKEWRLVEEKEPRDEAMGYWPFGIYYYDDKNISFSFNFTGVNKLISFFGGAKKDVVMKASVPEKLVYYLKQFHAYDANTFAGFKMVNVHGGEMYLYKYKDEKISETRALFYVKKTDAICDVSLEVMKNHEYIDDLRPYRKIFLGILKRIIM